MLEAPQQVAAGQVVTLNVRLEGLQGGDMQVGGFEAQILYDQTAAEFAGFSPLAPQAGEGRGQMVVPEVNGGSAVAFYTCDTAPCLQASALQAKEAAGPGLLAKVELLALEEGRFEVKIDHVQVVNPSGQLIAVNVAQAGVVVQVGNGSELHAAPASSWQWKAKSAQVVDTTTADVTQDGQISHGDVMDVAMSWETEREKGTPCGGSELSSESNSDIHTADINRDNCVDIVDVQQAAHLASESMPDLPDHLFLPLTQDADNAGQAAVAQAATPMAALTFTVNTTSDEIDSKIGDGICQTASQTCSLRAAISEANAHPGPDSILFNIPGSGVQTIQLTDHLPTLSDSAGGALINGYSQPGSAPNSDPVISNAQIRIQIRGNGFNSFDGLAISSAGNAVRGLSFFNFKRSLWIYGPGAHDNVIAGDFVGTDAAGTFYFTATATLQAHGVHVEQQASHNHFGGVLPTPQCHLR